MPQTHSALAAQYDDALKTIVRLRKLAVEVVATSHQLQNGKNDTPEGYVLVKMDAVQSLAAALSE